MTRYYLALDTSLTKSGWAVLSVVNRKPSIVEYGLIRSTAKLSDGERLRQIHSGITAVLDKYPRVERTIPREEGIVRFNIPTRQVFKAHGTTEFALADYDIVDINIQSVKAWARRVTDSPGRRSDKAMVAEAVRIYFDDDSIEFTKGGDDSDAVAVGLVYLIKEGCIPHDKQV